MEQHAGTLRRSWSPLEKRFGGGGVRLLLACLHACTTALYLSTWMTHATPAASACLQVVEQYTGHASIAYGADWYRGCWPPQADSCSTGCSMGGGGNDAQQGSPHESTSTAAAGAAAEALAGLVLAAQQQQQQAGLAGQGSRDFVATCSFYDRRLHLWSPGGPV